MSWHRVWVRPWFVRRLEDVNLRRQERDIFSRCALLRRRQRPDQEVVEFFLEREAVKVMIGEVREDEPELAEVLRVEPIKLG